MKQGGADFNHQTTVSLSLLGQRRLNSSMAASMSSGISLCMERRESPASLSVLIADLKEDFVRLSTLNDLSAEQVVTGKVQRMLISTFMF